MEVRVFFQYHLPIRIIDGQPIRAGSYWLPIKIEVFLRHAGLGVKHFGFPRNRRKKWHRQPVNKLRIFAFHADAISIAIHHFCARQGIGVQVRICPRLRFRRFVECVAQLFQADNVFAHQTKNRRADFRTGETFDLVYVVSGNEFTRALVLKLANLLLAAHV